MKQFESDLKTIQSASAVSDLILARDLQIPPHRLQFLDALGLIELRSFYDDDLRIILTDSGVTYFFTKSDQRKQSITQWCINLLVAVFAAMFGSTFTLFLQWIITK